MGPEVIVLDTHVLVFWVQEPAYLSRRATRALEAAETIGVPSIVFWEVALLVRKKRLELSGGLMAAEWTTRILAIPRIRPLALTPSIAVAADALEMHSDPADRFIVATAIEYEAPLVTRDTALRDVALKNASGMKTIW